MKKLFNLLLLLAIIKPALAQETEVKPKLDFKGSVRYQLFFHAYQSTETRDGVLYLYPKILDTAIINQADKLGSSVFFSRFQAKFSGSKAFGANVTALIEGDFFGTHQNYTAHFRGRHAFVKLNWEKTSVLFGQYWHTIVDIDVLPYSHLVANVPYFPLNRAPQVSATYKVQDKITLAASALVHSYHKNTAPPLVEAQRNSGIPELAVKIKYSDGPVVIGINGGINTLQPRISTKKGYPTSKKFSSPYAGIFASYKPKFFTVKTQLVYGQNLTHFTMIGGYGSLENPDSTDNFGYSPMTTFTGWSDIFSNSEKVQIGLFGGYSKNLGANDSYFVLADCSRNDDL